MNHAVSKVTAVHNKAGMFGAYCSGFLVDLVGFGAYIFPAFFLTTGGRRILGAPIWAWWHWFAFAVLGCCLAVSGSVWQFGILAVRGGGLWGHILYDFSIAYFNAVGTAMVWGFIFLLSLQTLFGFSWLALIRESAGVLATLLRRSRVEFIKYREQLRTGTDRADGVQRHPLVLPELNADSTISPKLPSVPLDRTGLLIGPPVPAPAPTDVDQAKLEVPEPRAREEEQSRYAVQDMTISLPDNDFGKNLDFLSTVLDDSDPPWLRDLEQGKVVPLAIRVSSPEQRSATSGKPEAAARSGSLDAPAAPSAVCQVADDKKYGDTHDSKEIVDGEQGSSTIKPSLIRNVALGANHDDNDAASAEEGNLGVRPDPANRSASRKSVPLPSLDLLHAAVSEGSGAPHHILEEKGRILMTCLADFGIQGNLSAITPGPVVTMFEVHPAPGIKVSRIANLSGDLARALKAIAVRIQAPIPGSDVVGIEIPNEVRETVCLKELFSSEAFQGEKSLLTMALGKDIAGRPVSADLARMPHLLVAGATGAGQSVCLNSILLSFLFKARPEEVKLLLVDPKRIEMAVYADLPHLIHPVVTEMDMAKNALGWAVSEMDERYKAIGRLKARNIATYNERLAELGPDRPEDLRDLVPMPYLVIIIDELADLMLTAAKEVETSIVRLAQLARAAGIHMILATQRPSVDVVTGLIKANFPCRISFQVTSKHDSRTILDAVGAEHLLGKGDMLFKPAGGKFRRLHGAFVSDDDVAATTDYWRRRQKPDYAIDFSEWGNEAVDDMPSGSSNGLDDVASDPVYEDAVDFVCQQGKASISLIQRRFRIGFNRAARFVEQMEKDGLIGPADGSKPRNVVRGKREE